MMKRILISLISLISLCLIAPSVNGQVTSPPENTSYKQMAEQSSNPSTPAPIQTMTFSGAGLNDAQIGGSYNKTTVATFVVTITTAGTPDRFDWVETGGTGSSAANVSITGSAQTLADGVTITFSATTGHTLTNTFTIKAIPTTREFWDSSGVKKSKVV